jgi:DNA-binding SARP family transcriptional activator
MNVRLLGPLEVEHDGAPLALGTPSQRALLARLLLDVNRTVAIDRLVDDIWGEDVPPTAVKMIHIHVSRLRKLLPPDVLVTRAPGYAVAMAPEAVDVVRFERLREKGRTALAIGSALQAAVHLRTALSLWRGPALAEFDEPFAAIEASRLEDLRLACLEDRIDADLRLGRHAVLVGELEALVARHPLRERPRGQLMVALYRSGRQAEALAVYRRLRELLVTELGLDPSPALRELERRMLQQDPGLEVATGPRRYAVAGASGNVVPVSSSESVHSRRAAASSLAAPLRLTRRGRPRCSAHPSGPA